MKKCMNRKCKSKGEVLPKEMFNRDPSKEDNLSDYCKECKREMATKRNSRIQENKEFFKMMFA